LSGILKLVNHSRKNRVTNLGECPIQGVIVMRAETKDDAVFRTAAATPVLRQCGNFDAPGVEFGDYVIGRLLTDKHGMQPASDGAKFSFFHVGKRLLNGGAPA